MKNLPTINEILETPLVKGLVSKLSRGEVVSTSLLVLGELAQQTRESALGMTLPTVTDVANRIADKLTQDNPARLVRTINATGKLFPPQLGAPPLAQEAISAMCELARDYTAMGRPLGAWDNSQQLRSVEFLVNQLVSAESVMAVNSGIAGWFLVLHALRTLAAEERKTGNSSQTPPNDRPIIISRSHLYELPPAARVTDIFAELQLPIIEVGSVNRTTINDFANAISESSLGIMYVYSGLDSINRTNEIPGIAELAKLAKSRKTPLIVDIGQCGLIPVKNELTASECLKNGADLVIMRGVSLFGGPDCGLILGKKNILDVCRKDNLASGLLCNPYTLTALEQTLLLYSQPDKGVNSIPVQQIVNFSEANLSNRGKRIAMQLTASSLVESAEIEIVRESPVMDKWLSLSLPTCRIAVKPKGISVEELTKRLAHTTPAVLGVVTADAFIIDMRTILPQQDIALTEAFFQ